MKKLFIKQKFFKLLDNYFVFDENGNNLYQVKESLAFFGKKVEVNSLIKSSSFYLEKQILAFFQTYNVNFSNGRSLNIVKNFTLFNKKISVSSDDIELTISGDFWDFNFGILSKEGEIGYIKKGVWNLTDCFEIVILDERYEEVMLAITIAIDDILDREER